MVNETPDDRLRRARLKAIKIGVLRNRLAGPEEVRTALERANDDVLLTKMESAFFLDITVATLSNEEKKSLTRPNPQRELVLNEGAAALKRIRRGEVLTAEDRAAARKEGQDAKLPETTAKKRKVAKSERVCYSIGELKRWKPGYLERRQAGLGRKKPPLTFEEQLEKRARNAAKQILIRGLAALDEMRPVIFDHDNRVVGLVEAHGWRAAELTPLFNEGAHIVSMSLHDALTEYSWLRASERELWEEVYRTVLELARLSTHEHDTKVD
jgi:hypothetical protein